MRSIARPLLVLHPDTRLRERVRRAAGRGFEWHEPEDWEALREATRSAPPAAVVVVDPYFGSDRELSPALRSFLWEYPSVTVVAATQIRGDRYRDLRALGSWGVADVIGIGEDDTPDAIARRLRSVQGRPLQSLLERSLPPSMGGQARSLLAAAAAVVTTGGAALEMARALYLSPRTLLRWCEKGGLPPPRRLLVWMRILLAAELLDDPGRTVASVAHACGYSSDNALRRTLQDVLNTTPTELRARGAFQVAAAGFVEELRRWETGPRARPA